MSNTTTRVLTPMQTIREVVKEASKETGVPQNVLFNCPAVISEAAVVVENNYIRGHYQTGNAAFWQMDKVLEIAEAMRPALNQN